MMSKIKGLELSVQEARRIGQALKPSRRWQKMVRSNEQGAVAGGSDQIGEVWMNHLYCANVWRDTHNEHFRQALPECVTIGLFSLDGEARHDWRDFQRIKNDIVGEEWEAIELYPAESRLIDTSNYFYLYCRPSWDIGKRIGRQIIHPNHSFAPQRPWPKGDEPAEILAGKGQA